MHFDFVHPGILFAGYYVVVVALETVMRCFALMKGGQPIDAVLLSRGKFKPLSSYHPCL